MTTGRPPREWGPLTYIKTGEGPTPDDLANDPWRTRAACRGVDTRSWFVDHPAKIIRSAQLVCSQCPVRRQCLAWALTFGEQYGVWGGLTPADRKPLAKRLRAGTTLATVLDVALGQHTGTQVA